MAAAVAIGGLGWSGYVLTLPLSLMFPALWAGAPNRFAAAAVSAGYFLAASRGLPLGVAEYFGTNVWAGILLWLAASISFVVVHAALWTGKTDGSRAIRYGLAAVLMAVPPFGIVGWAHPITAAGVLFPGMGWWGLAVTMTVLVLMTTKVWPFIAIGVLGIWTWSTAFWTDPVPPPGWAGIDMNQGTELGTGSTLAQQQRLLRLVNDRSTAGAHVVVLPESALGILTPTVAALWAQELIGRDMTVVAGAVVIGPQGYDNAMVAIDGRRATVPYRSRMPVPVSMWQPWRVWFGEAGGARATFFADPVVLIAGRRVAPLICYEQLLVWPILQSASHRPDTVVAIANGWWATGTSVPAIQRASVQAWARLFDLPLVTAFNL